MNDERNEKLNNLALDVLRLSRNTLLVNLRFLDSALSRFKYIPTDESTLLTDGEDLLYNPEHILKRYKHEKERPVRDYLHIVFHCIYRHMFMDPSLDRPLWDLACDIAVENVITELGIRSTTSEIESLQQNFINELKSKTKLLTAEKIYRCFKDENLDPMKAADIRARFYADNHEIWYMSGEEKEKKYGISAGKKTVILVKTVKAAPQCQKRNLRRCGKIFPNAWEWILKHSQKCRDAMPEALLRTSLR